MKTPQKHSRSREAGFTLIEMVIVLMIISVLLLIAVPSLSKNTQVAQDRGCDATVELLQGQVGAYKVNEEKELNNLNELVSENYVETISCPDGTELSLVNGKVVRPSGAE
ncbi:competence type IV pilus major pilin ComGC [Alteribacter natronophilus]|uniref:competence type IV pilus major pilin ComGC n=1 Tax=Alteribacter natronophilus TaxID=2583810 RepID=UPI00110EAAE1|nr:competence type IV pilus major pilin ComGC [Alteribacter natronophilus]TMW73781.1 prepilin-type N-terminal cleavage/methylation domain-containing protein [Alteribacter natronophilus]